MSPVHWLLPNSGLAACGLLISEDPDKRVSRDPRAVTCKKCATHFGEY